ncbi:MAG: VCBS repeat-containing protein [Cytophagales bacterium]|nr:VCBS repeat-containing protein [Cytophagales bacterium]
MMHRLVPPARIWIMMDLSTLSFAEPSGVYLYLNKGVSFATKKLTLPLNEKTTSVSISLGDVNKDGLLDMFVAGYIKMDKMEGQTIFNDPNYGATSLLMINTGDNSFKDATVTFGLNYIHNTFQGILVDVDRDGWLDLVVAHDTGEVRTYKNLGGSAFEERKTQSPASLPTRWALLPVIIIMTAELTFSFPTQDLQCQNLWPRRPSR